MINFLQVGPSAEPSKATTFCFGVSVFCFWCKTWGRGVCSACLVIDRMIDFATVPA